MIPLSHSGRSQKVLFLSRPQFPHLCSGNVGPGDPLGASQQRASTSDAKRPTQGVGVGPPGQGGGYPPLCRSSEPTGHQGWALRGDSPPGRTEWDGRRATHATQNGAQFRTYILSISGIFCLVFTDRGRAQVAAAGETKPREGGDAAGDTRGAWGRAGSLCRAPERQVCGPAGPASRLPVTAGDKARAAPGKSHQIPGTRGLNAGPCGVDPARPSASRQPGALEEAEADPHAPGVPSPGLPGMSGPPLATRGPLSLSLGAVRWPQLSGNEECVEGPPQASECSAARQGGQHLGDRPHLRCANSLRQTPTRSPAGHGFYPGNESGKC